MIRLRKTIDPECPSWCVLRHGRHDPAEDRHVHVGGALLVGNTVLRLCATLDPAAGSQDGPYVLLGSTELTLHEADALIAALTQLVDEGRASLLAQQPERALPVLDAQLAQDRGDMDPDRGR